MAITAADLKELAAQYNKAAGQVYVNDDTTLLKTMTRRLKVMSELSYRFYSDTVDFTMTANQTTYDLTTANAAFTISGTQRKMLAVTNVIVNGYPLRNFSGLVAGVSQDEMDDLWPQYRTASADIPTRWWVTGAGTLHVAAKPTSACISAGSNYVSAFYSHPVVSSTSDSILFMDEDLEYLAKDLAYYLGMAYSQPGTAAFDKLRMYYDEAQVWAKVQKDNALAQFSAPATRGVTQRSATVVLS